MNVALPSLSIPVLRFFLLVLCALQLTACVTTQTGGFGDKKDDKKALQVSLQLANDYMNSGQWDAAKLHLQKAIELDDRFPQVYAALALIHQHAGEYELADESFEKSLRYDRDQPGVRINYANFLYDMKRYQDAVEQLEVVTEDTLYQYRGLAFVNLGRCYIQLGDFEQAELALRRAYMIDKGNVALLLELADVYFVLENYPESQLYYDAYRKQVEQQPARALWLGILLADIFDNDDALTSYTLVLKNLYPTSQQYLDYKKKFIEGS